LLQQFRERRSGAGFPGHRSTSCLDRYLGIGGKSALA
jgi:hypothetical protein